MPSRTRPGSAATPAAASSPAVHAGTGATAPGSAPHATIPEPGPGSSVSLAASRQIAGIASTSARPAAASRGGSFARRGPPSRPGAPPSPSGQHDVATGPAAAGTVASGSIGGPLARGGQRPPMLPHQTRLSRNRPGVSHGNRSRPSRVPGTRHAAAPAAATQRDQRPGEPSVAIRDHQARRAPPRSGVTSQARTHSDLNRTPVEVAQKIGINESTLGYWVKAYRRNHSGKELPLDMPHRARLNELERRVKELEQENAFLKNAAAYFAREHR